MSEGWIKLHRSIQDHWVWKDFPYSEGQAWIDLLLLANHEDKKIAYKGEIITCEKGTVNRSISSLAERWNWSRDRTRRFLHLLESDGMCVVKATTNRTTITIENYGFYQDSVTTNNATDNATSNTTSRQRVSQRVDTNKNDKNEKNDKNNNHIGSFGSPKVDELFAEFVKMRKQMKKPMTAHAIELAVTKLEKLSGGIEDTAIKIIEQTLEHSWQTFYELKTDNRSRNPKSGTKFNDFEQTHNYDMTDLEKMLLS